MVTEAEPSLMRPAVMSTSSGTLGKAGVAMEEAARGSRTRALEERTEPSSPRSVTTTMPSTGFGSLSVKAAAAPRATERRLTMTSATGAGRAGSETSTAAGAGSRTRSMMRRLISRGRSPMLG